MNDPVLLARALEAAGRGVEVLTRPGGGGLLIVATDPDGTATVWATCPHCEAISLPLASVVWALSWRCPLCEERARAAEARRLCLDLLRRREGSDAEGAGDAPVCADESRAALERLATARGRAGEPDQSPAGCIAAARA